jgi:tol-pal system protein YbgF
MKLRIWGLWLIAVCCLPFLCGCLTRGSGPELPYIKPAQSVPPVDQTQIRTITRLDEMELELQKLRALIEKIELSGKNTDTLRSLQDRVALIEEKIGISGGSHQASSEQLNRVTDSRAPEVPSNQKTHTANSRTTEIAPAAPIEIQNQPVSQDEKIYREAYAHFKKGEYDPAVTQFEELMKNYPQTSLAADALYWIGEAKFNQGKFEEAVLQFDRVLKEYPGSKKELNALLKQGQSFEKMGDSQSAKIIFKKLVTEHPHTAQGRIAGGRLKAVN